MSRSLSYGAWLLAVWIALWERLTVANVASGAAVVVVLLVAFPPGREGRVGALRPLAAARFLAYFLWKLAVASAIVGWEVVTPRNRVEEGIVAVRLRGVDRGVTTVVANAVSLVPGTVTIEVHEDPFVLYVHVLHLHDREAVRKEVLHLEALAARALGRRDVVDAAVPVASAGARPSAAAPAARSSEEPT